MDFSETLLESARLFLGVLLLALLAGAAVCPALAQGSPSSAATPALMPAAAVARQREELLNRQWDPGKLYAILSSSHAAAKENLYRAAFAAGPVIIPKLVAALKDDRTAEFAAQELAFLGGKKATAVLAGLVNDPRNLDLRRFYYGALGGTDDPQSIGILLDKIRNSDQESDRTVTQDAILALSISSDPGLIAKLHEAGKDVTDPVIQDDINTAMTVIDLRAKYLATSAGKNSGRSVRQAVRTYFMPALEPPPDSSQAGEQDYKAEVRIKDHLITFSPDKTRALAAVNFETQQAVAAYWLVLQKTPAGWKVASAWLGEEREKAPPAQAPAASQPAEPQ